MFAACPRTQAEDKAPAFLKVGAGYKANMAMGPLRFSVIELGDGPWVKARVLTENMGIVWLNTTQFWAITEESGPAR